MRALPSRRNGVLLNTFTRAYLALVIGRPVVTLLLLAAVAVLAAGVAAAVAVARL